MKLFGNGIQMYVMEDMTLTIRTGLEGDIIREQEAILVYADDGVVGACDLD